MAATAAARELSKSIAEINHQLVRASDVVREAAVEAQSTNQDIAGLAQAAQKIDDVVKLIQSVAGQTNLPGAECDDRGGRSAGTAGKGFAVVAAEVKALAVQTAKATDDIAAQIAAVQGSTRSAVRAIGSITTRMDEIQQFTGAIAAAVEEQHASTSEISNNVAAAATGAKSVASVLRRVTGAIADMHSSADTVLAARHNPWRRRPAACAAASTTASFARWRFSDLQIKRRNSLLRRRAPDYLQLSWLGTGSKHFEFMQRRGATC